MAAHGGRGAKCSRCLKPAPGYDRLESRAWLFVPLWGIVTWFLYAARRVNCPEHGVVVEHVPWSAGKRPVTLAMMCFLSRWARRLSWRETARVFGTSWQCVYRSVEWFVEWGLANRVLAGIKAIGVDEIFWGRGRKSEAFLTVIYQIDGHCRRLLWVGRKRTQATLRRGLEALGSEVVGGLQYVCSDMWKPYLKVLAQRVGQALHILDRFHITMHLNQAVDQVRRAESTRLKGQPLAGAAQEDALEIIAQGQPRPGSGQVEIGRAVGQPTGDGQGVGFEGGVSAFLEVSLSDLGGRFFGLLDRTGHAQPVGTDEESRPNAARA